MLTREQVTERYKPGDFRLLYQNVWWITRDNKVLTLSEMDPDHKVNLLGWFERRARVALWREYLEWSAQACDEYMSDTNQMIAESEAFRSGELFVERKEQEWLRSQPLIKRLDMDTATQKGDPDGE
jgi:hypothetical protein